MILFSETDLKSQSAARDVIRGMAAGIDKAVYGLLSAVFQLFFSIASADIFSSGMISKFYARIQLVIGVFMMFQLAMTILRGIVNPDGFTDSKSGAGNIIMRICTALVMLSLIVPINLPSASNEFEKQINNNGLLFGTLYSLQHRILSNNTIGKVVMGVGDNEGDNFMAANGNESFKKSADVFTATIVKGFYRINLIPEEDRTHEEGKEDDQINSNRVCQDIDDDIINEYKKIDANPGSIIDLINTPCSKGDWLDKLKSKLPWKNWNGSQLYAFTFMPVISTIIGILFVLIILSFCVDVATRAIKLAILRLLAPIPIISYMDPKGGKDEAFSAWTKMLISTYLDLFIRVASVYFVIYMIQEMLVHGISTSSTGMLKFFTVLFIWIALFYFAKEAPKFIKQVLGIKDDGSGGGIFSGLGKITGAASRTAAIGAAGLGTIGSAVTNYKAAKEENEALGRRFSGVRNVGSALAGAIAGGATGLKAATGKDGNIKSVMAAQGARNATRASHSTWAGRAADSAYSMFTGQSLADRTAKHSETNKKAAEEITAFQKGVQNEAIKNGGIFTYKLANGETITARYSQVAAAVEAGADQDGMITIGGKKYAADQFGSDVMGKMLDKQVAAWKDGAAGAPEGSHTYAEIVLSPTGKLHASHETTLKAVNDAKLEVEVDGVTYSGEGIVENYKVLGPSIGQANREVQQIETDMKQRMRVANKKKTGTGN